MDTEIKEVENELRGMQEKRKAIEEEATTVLEGLQKVTVSFIFLFVA